MPPYVSLVSEEPARKNAPLRRKVSFQLPDLFGRRILAHSGREISLFQEGPMETRNRIQRIR